MSDPYGLPPHFWQEWRQEDHLAQTPWTHRDPTKRGGARAHADGFKGGACYGYAILYAKCGCDLARFKAALATPEGLAIVRGIQNASMTIRRDNPEAYVRVTEAALFAHGLYPAGPMIKEFSVGAGLRLAHRHQRVHDDIVRAVSEGDGIFPFLYQTGSYAHIVVFHRVGNQVTLFDPNIGKATATLEGLRRLLSHWDFGNWGYSYRREYIVMWRIQRFRG